MTPHSKELLLEKKSKALKRMSTSSPFQSAYEKLNEHQKQAVDTIEGPVMCIAGPGTGKTQVLALRIANILKKTQMRPSNILCLTFSINGAVEMRERLRKFIGRDAYAVTVKNFHSFCNDIIQEHPEAFDQWAALNHISPVERYRELNKIIDQLLPDLSIVNKKDPYGRTRDLLSRISQLKREGVTDPAVLARVEKEYRSEMEGKSKEGTKAHEKNVSSADKFSDLLKIFDAYQNMLERTKRYDFEDMILRVIQALKEEDWLLASYQERYQYILVDEFQDTNGAQYELIRLLATTHLQNDPNIFVVGDDDQAIYRFQGATLKNILSFHSQFPKAVTVTLDTSYRCTQPILDAATSLISLNTERLVGTIPGIEKDLKSARKIPGKSPELLFSPSDMSEPWMIADCIDEKIEEGIPPSEIAILVQKNAEMKTYYDVLMGRGIACQMDGKVDLLTRPLVLEALSILRAIAHPTDATLAAALACSCFHCHPADLGRLFQETRTKDAHLLSLLLDLEKTDLLLTHKEALLHARDVLLSLHQNIENRTVIDTLEKLLKETGLLKTATNGAESDFDVSEFLALQEFFDRIKDRAHEDPAFTFDTFLSDLSYYENSDYSDLRLSFDLPHLTSEGVQIMTAHQSKGKEFTIVILPNFREGHWNKKRNPSGVSVPEDLLFGWHKEQKETEKNQDERRLTYVAMTRAKDELMFTCPRTLTTGEKVREVSPSAFFAEAGQLPEKEVPLNEPTKASLLMLPAPKIDSALKNFLTERLEHYSLSVTGLNHFLEDPRMFLEVDLLGMPQPSRTEFAYGSAVHDALKTWAIAYQGKKAFSSEDFVNQFERYLTDRTVLTERERQNLLAMGKHALPRFYEQRLALTTSFIHKVEYPVTTHLEDIPLKGAIDRIDLEREGARLATVIDYKTGAPKTENEILDDGNLFRQLTFYSLLLDQKFTGIEPVEFVLDFVGEGTNHPVRRAFTIAEDHKKDLTKVIADVWKKITALDFTPLA